MPRATRRITPAIALALGLIPAAILGLAQPAQAVLPASVQASIADAARETTDMAEQDARVARTLGNPGLADELRRNSRQRAEATMSAAVIGAIAEHPSLAGEIVATASAAAPTLAPAVARNAAQAFPGFAGAFRATGDGRAPAPAIPAADRSRPAATDSPPPADDESAAAGDDEIYDPLEPLNRAILGFNEVVDALVLRPVADLYRLFTPEAARRSVRNAIDNMRAPVIFANDLLQLEGGFAAVTAGRFIINSTAGIAGLFDVAESMGFEKHPADFGQTLHAYGTGAGPYLMLPVLGPSNLRDGAGLVFDMFLDPLTYLLDIEERLMIAGGKAIVRREDLIDPLDELRKQSLDYYAALRSAYQQDRAVELRRGKPDDGRKLDRLFESID